MTQTNYTTKHRKNKHLTIKERAQIEMLLQQGKTKSEIARVIGIPRSTLYNELHRGTVDQMDTNLEVHQKNTLLMQVRRYMKSIVKIHVTLTSLQRRIIL